ncbi:hypothetical protein [Adhaeretor mobilis]|uniref:Uncharacterized protein n=1 Tax=Adhaeretor mobilis TaxID=1930276 RepID=A0A517MR30_9BACT|nr:hypothetical protein [Adhaeretor mobilis]QDS97343.1 hypothetical protein HG15A2_06040 [Adhaeretor mobilis]
MEWLFERMIELGAWFAFVLGVIFAGGALWNLLWWAIGLFGGEADLTFAEKMAFQQGLLITAAQAAIGFIFSAMALGVLACIDRYVFDVPEDQ